MPALRILESKIRTGRLNLRLPGQPLRRFGSGDPHVDWIVHDRHTLAKIARNPGLALGETYMNGEWDAGGRDLRALLLLFTRNFAPLDKRELAHPMRAASRWFQQFNSRTRSARNAAHHYNVDEWLYRRVLDRDMHYSCAYFQRPNQSLEDAQQAKCRHLMQKLRLEPGMRVLDIGCGWGSLAITMAEHAGVEVVGLTLAAEQIRVARARAAQAGLEQRVQFQLQDYREHRGEYDRVVSVGMFEHVGRPHFGTFFHAVRELLKPAGVAVVHTIGRMGPPGSTNPWIQRYIFPGGYIPSLSEICGKVERTRLVNNDVEVLRLHYAETLAHWYERFHCNRGAIVERMGERFARMWEFYLAACEASFRADDLVVFQIQLTRALDVIPMTRDYLYPRSVRLEVVGQRRRDRTA